ncbi:MAG: NAD(+)--dinitrogen-reductase ADP-D-ribosyltransferase [Azospirillum sp.]|nr:NAD(+)--dinitrogen-reductase ADP-D-ribosyltransferase [Azospirillum sp.]
MIELPYRPEHETPAHLKGDRGNLVRVPVSRLSSVQFNDAPEPLHIAGTLSHFTELFRELDGTDNPEAAAERLQATMSATFGLNPDFSGRQGADGKRRFNPSYLRLLKGWMFDANGAEGAVLKGWAESRFGLFPTFHKAPIRGFGGEAWTAYAEQKVSSRFHSPMINLQLDLLYEFCQWWLGHRWADRAKLGDGRHVTLYRGVNDFTEHPILERPDKKCAVIRLNSLVSFTNERDIAGQFGDYILEARVPLVKLLFFRELLPRYPFAGEGEFLVIGGDYRVTVATV